MASYSYCGIEYKSHLWKLCWDSTVLILKEASAFEYSGQKVSYKVAEMVS